MPSRILTDNRTIIRNPTRSSHFHNRFILLDGHSMTSSSSGVLIQSTLIILSLFPCLLYGASDTSFENDLHSIITRISPQFENQTEERIVQKQLGGFLQGVKHIKGMKKWKAFLREFNNSENVSQSLIAVYRKTPYQLAGDIARKMNRKLEKHSGQPFTTMQCGDITGIFSKGSPVESDSAEISYLLNYYNKLVATALLDNATSRQRYKKNITNMKDSTITLYLLNNRKDITNHFGKTNGMAAMLLSHQFNDDSLLQIEARMLFKYYGLFMMSALVHELTHVYWALRYISPEFTEPISGNLTIEQQQRLTDAFAPFTADTPLKEGVAEYLNEEFNLLIKYDIIENVDTILRSYFKQTGKSFDLGELQKRIYRVNDKMPTYEIAHSFFRFLVTKYGFETALAVSYSTQSPDEYRRITGDTFSSINNEWRLHISGKQP